MRLFVSSVWPLSIRLLRAMSTGHHALVVGRRRWPRARPTQVKIVAPVGLS